MRKNPTSSLQAIKQPIISVKEARKLLGSSSRTLDDTQVSKIINALQLIARKYFENSGSKDLSGL